MKDLLRASFILGLLALPLVVDIVAWVYASRAGGGYLWLWLHVGQPVGLVVWIFMLLIAQMWVETWKKSS